MDLEPTQFQTKKVKLRSLEISDSELILRIRNSPRGSSLKQISPSLADQQEYMRNYVERFKTGEEIYFGIYSVVTQDPIGLVRMTDLKQETRFNWASLILTAESPPIAAIDTILAVYSIGFELLKRSECGPFPVRKDVPRVLKLHQTIGMSHVSSIDDETVYLTTTATEFEKGIDRYRKMGVGVLVR